MGDAKPLLVVFGAGGGTGLACVERCVQQAFRVRAVVRVPDAHRGRMPPDVELVAGDVTDDTSIAAALRGAHGVVFAASASSYLGADDVDHKARAWQQRAALLALCSRVQHRALPLWVWQRVRRACGASCSSAPRLSRRTTTGRPSASS